MSEAKIITLEDQPVARAPQGGWLSAQSMRLLLYVASITLDVMAVAASFYISELIIGWRWMPVSDSVVLAIVIPLFVMFSISREVQAVETLQDYWLGFQRAASALIGAFIVSVMLLFLTDYADKFSRLLFLTYALVSLAMLALSKLALNWAVKVWMGGRVVATLLLVDGQTVETGEGVTRIDVGSMGI